MRTFMVILAIIGVFTLGVGISSYYNALTGGEAVGGFFGLIFGVTFMILGGVILLADIIFFIMYRKRRRSVMKKETMQ